MRLLNPLLTRELAQLASEHVLTMAFELTMPLAPVPYRVVNYDQPITFAGLEFLAFPIAVDALEDATSAAVVHLRLTAANVDQAIPSLCENYWTNDALWMLRVWQLDVRQPDLTSFDAADVFAVMSVTTNVFTATFDIMAEGLTLATLIPKRRYTVSNGYPFIPRR
jgi:hypothetical protein